MNLCLLSSLTNSKFLLSPKKRVIAIKDKDKMFLSEYLPSLLSSLLLCFEGHKSLNILFLQEL